MKKYINAFRKRLADLSFKGHINVSTSRTVVSFTFDDAPKSAFTTGQSILDEYALKATFYISLSFLDSRTENKSLFSKEDLEHCVSNGHELGCHTFGHNHFYQSGSAVEIEKDISKNNEVLNEIGLKIKLKNFSYPFGEQTRRSKSIVSKRFDSCRGIDHGINTGPTDINNLKSIKLYEQTHTIDKICSILKDFSKTGGWLIFYTHDVETNFSKYGCSPEYFRKVVSKFIELGIDIKPINEVVEEQSQE